MVTFRCIVPFSVLTQYSFSDVMTQSTPFLQKSLYEEIIKSFTKIGLIMSLCHR